MRKVVIVGGGISGLCVAYQLQELSRAQKSPLEITLLEASPRLGGLLETESRDSFLVEHGPDAFLSEKPSAMKLIERLGLGDQLIPTQESMRRSFVFQKNQLKPIPEGFYLMAPKSMRLALKLSQLSFRGRVRAAMEPFVKIHRERQDESVASFVRRRLGSETLKKLAQPLLAGIYMADPEKLSLAATMPQFFEMEKNQGGVIRGLAQKKKGSDASGARYSLFVSLKNGMGSLVSQLIKAMPDVNIKTSSPVSSIECDAGHSFLVKGREDLHAQQICLALPAFLSSHLIRDFAGEVSEDLDKIPYESCIIAQFAFKKEDVKHPCDGFGFVVPYEEGERIVACSFSSVKFQGRAPEGTLLVRAFMGGALHRDLFQLDDESLRNMAYRELKRILGIEKEPLFSSLRRYDKSMPQYHVGHLARVDAIEKHIRKYPGLYLAGNAYRGVGIPDTIAYAQKVATKMFEEIL